MAKILVTPELLSAKAGELKGLQAEHEAVMARITTLVGSLVEQWTGEASDAFQQSFESMRPTFQRFIEILDNYSLKMNETARTMESADQSIKGSIQSFQ